jgi:hypothetical protein
MLLLNFSWRRSNKEEESFIGKQTELNVTTRLGTRESMKGPGPVPRDATMCHDKSIINDPLGGLSAHLLSTLLVPCLRGKFSSRGRKDVDTAEKKIEIK